MIEISEAGRRYGRKQPQPLPAHMMLSRISPNLPSVVDLRAWGGAVKDQGDEGSCTGHAGSSKGEWISKKYFGHPITFSPQYIYANELIAQGDFPQDEGSSGETLCEVMIALGNCPVEEFPYIAGDITRPTPDQIAAARPYKLGAYHGLTGSQVAQSVLGDATPWPILVGFNVAASFESSTVAATGVYNPQPNEKIVGGHEVLCLGCDLGDVPTSRPAGSAPSFLIQNSWGSAWGWQGGYFWMPASVFDDPQTDLKIVHPGAAWK